MLEPVRSALRALVQRRRFEDGMAEELRFHIDQYTDELVRSGVSPEAAARRARVEFGNPDNVRADCRQARGLRLFDELQQDVRYAFRTMRRTPGFTVTALAILALCLGANLAIFAVVDSVLLRPLPFPDADRLVRIFNTYPKASVPDDGATVTNYYERRGKVPAFAALALYRERTAIVGETGATEREHVMRVSPGFFATLGVGPVIGREFGEEETTYQTDRVAILTDAYWRRHFGANPAVIGRTIRVDGFDVTIVGVLPGTFRFLSSKAQLYFPLASSPDEREARRRHWGSSSHMVGRLAPGVTLAGAQSAVDAHNAVLEQDSPEAAFMTAAGFRSLVVPLHGDHVAPVRPTLLLVQAAALFLLLIGAVNLVNLFLVRAGGRLKELAIRQAIGASRRRVVSEVLVETMLVTLPGGVLGLAVGAAGIRLLAWLGTDRFPLGTHIALDARVALVALLGTLVTGIAIGIPVAWYSLKAHTAAALQSHSRGNTANRTTQRLRHGFLVAQIGLAFVLLAGAAMLARSLENVLSVTPGFRSENVLSGSISVPYLDPAARLAFVERLVQAALGQPGVLSAGIVSNVPLSGQSGKSSAKVKGHTLEPGEAPRGIYSYSVAGDYFAAMGFALREGRFLSAADSRRKDRVCVVDEDFARRYWPQGHAIGQRLFQGSKEGPEAEAFTIVGVVGAVKQADLTDDTAQGAVFYPFGHRSDGGIFLVVRTSMAPESLASTLRHVVRSTDPELPVTDVRSMEGRIADSLIARRSPALLAGAFAAMALLLTAIGTYGVLSYAVTLRRREIGLRMALGARSTQVRRQFVSMTARLLTTGTVLGGIGAVASGRAMNALLFGVPAVHLPTLAATAGVIAVVGLAACLWPADRAARISPMEALADD